MIEAKKAYESKCPLDNSKCPQECPKQGCCGNQGFTPFCCGICCGIIVLLFLLVAILIPKPPVEEIDASYLAPSVIIFCMLRPLSAALTCSSPLLHS